MYQLEYLSAYPVSYIKYEKVNGMVKEIAINVHITQGNQEIDKVEIGQVYTLEEWAKKKKG